MKTLYFDCAMGAAGDMLTAALLELVSDKEAFVKKLNALKIPGVVYRAEAAEKCGIRGTHMTVTVNGEEEEAGEDVHEHDHDHEHDHEPHHDHDHDHEHHHDHDHDHDHEHHHHHHSGMHEIEHIVEDLPVSSYVRRSVLGVYRLIAEAESHAHGVPVTEIHFHEVGTMDAVADVTAVCLLMEELKPDKVVVSPIPVGSGQVRCAHGILPVPAPATAYILRDAPIYGGKIRGELCTPTGAALLRYFADEFGPMPVMKTEAIGYGMGKKDFEAANCVRTFIGSSDDQVGTVTELACNVDDMTAEELGFAMERLFEAGALDVWTTPAGMKKNRPGVVLSLLVRDEKKDAAVAALFRYTTTIGIRESVMKRYTLSRKSRTIETAYGPVREKISSGYGVQRTKYEFDDLSAIAREQGISLSEVRKAIEK